MDSINGLSKKWWCLERLVCKGGLWRCSFYESVFSPIFRGRRVFWTVTLTVFRWVDWIISFKIVPHTFRIRKGESLGSPSVQPNHDKA
jgi:hypothetical protein